MHCTHHLLYTCRVTVAPTYSCCAFTGPHTRFPRLEHGVFTMHTATHWNTLHTRVYHAGTHCTRVFPMPEHTAQVCFPCWNALHMHVCFSCRDIRTAHACSHAGTHCTRVFPMVEHAAHVCFSCRNSRTAHACFSYWNTLYSRIFHAGTRCKRVFLMPEHTAHLCFSCLNTLHTPVYTKHACFSCLNTMHTRVSLA